ncbi:hypothetical protein A2U01_0106438, partial [Trifolium medium]|nr:hypothetical protein [Trifolium medium]
CSSINPKELKSASQKEGGDTLLFSLFLQQTGRGTSRFSATTSVDSWATASPPSSRFWVLPP